MMGLVFNDLGQETKEFPQRGLDMEEFYQGKFGSMVRTMLKKEDCKFEI